MHAFINSSLKIGSLTLPNRLIQGPLAGYSCAPFRTLFSHYRSPAYSVTEMSSATDILHKHTENSRYVYRAPQEQILAYQIAGTESHIMAQAAQQLQFYGADVIDINCGCPKPKIRKKGAGSALLEAPEQLLRIVKEVRTAIAIPLTIKIRIQGNEKDFLLAKKIEDAGADALIVHGRRWIDDYDVATDLQQIAQIKQNISIPVIANGDIHDARSLHRAIEISGCDAYMISRAGSGKPWLYQELLEQRSLPVSLTEKCDLFMTHLQGLAELEDEYKAVLQSKSLVRYYFGKLVEASLLNRFYQLDSLEDIHGFLWKFKANHYSLDCNV
ncbi:tRNA dihydrouridine synthase [Legionella parisiensis]|uniref:tRNA-dihydrouridine synthase n=1 Tax=Legionella parisiensis TaxID=45071 RepID=A0A1E5JM19_9GAMM|nr:tRNA-dihydrouridine synthase family protein [Legionella parisiensis]KTD42687.1 tRNA-dihydrouridine synthase B [Legionella parisiensis]OEH45581.1 tRNA-dihydrouridine synthase C [Legionella parisiensis]STX71634.1 tRNA-dihydrouridine synthase B [Legionella parisiensis]